MECDSVPIYVFRNFEVRLYVVIFPAINMSRKIVLSAPYSERALLAQKMLDPYILNGRETTGSTYIAACLVRADKIAQYECCTCDSKLTLVAPFVNSGGSSIK